MKPKFNIGDRVWYAQLVHDERRVKCPDCLGTGALTVEMADGARFTIECKLCAPCFESPTGWIKEYVARIETRSANVIGMELEGYGESVKTNYRLDTLYSMEERDIFATREEAKVREAELLEKDAKEQQRQLLWKKEDSRRTWAWNASYHRRGLKQAKHDLEYHTMKLNAAKIASKETTPND